MSPAVTAFAARLDALALKERVLALGAALLVLLLGWTRLAFEPLEVDKRALQSQITERRTSQAQFDAEAVQIVEASRNDPNLPLRQQIESAEQQTAQFESEIREQAGQLVAPDEMAQILRSVLESTVGLEFVSLEGLGAEPLLPTMPATAGGAAAPVIPDAPDTKINAYRHGFRIRFNGSYLATLAYLRALEALPWRFFWDAIEINVDQHPDASTSIVVYTLSLDRRWIGV